jgi:hypothetical protein
MNFKHMMVQPLIGSITGLIMAYWITSHLDCKGIELCNDTKFMCWILVGVMPYVVMISINYHLDKKYGTSKKSKEESKT